MKAEKTAATTAAPESDAVDETKAPTSTTQAQEAPTTAAATAKEATNDANSTATSATIDKEKVSATVDQTKEYAKSYWNWLTTSVKHPFSYPETTNPLYGITTFIIFAIVSALILIVSGRQTFNALDSKVKVSVIMENPFTFGVFLKFLAIFAVLFALMVLAGLNLGFIATFFEEKLKFEFDRIYVAILAEAVLFIALYLGVEHILIPAITQVGTSFN